MLEKKKQFASFNLQTIQFRLDRHHHDEILKSKTQKFNNIKKRKNIDLKVNSLRQSHDHVAKTIRSSIESR